MLVWLPTRSKVSGEFNDEPPQATRSWTRQSSKHWQFARSLATTATYVGRLEALRSHVVFERTFSNREAEVVFYPLNAVGTGCVTVAIV